MKKCYISINLILILKIFFIEATENGNTEAECSIQSSSIPDPKTGCCGQDMSDSEKIKDLQIILSIFAPDNPSWANHPFQILSQTKPVLNDRISGGTKTKLDQFPWTVNLDIMYNFNGTLKSAICGGSLISPTHVLTASHCFSETGGTLLEILITLAEYDKKTFPRDCEPGLGQVNCIDNIIMHVKTLIPHPEYDDDTFQNDIALVELDGYAPFTQYIRPICVPPINVDDPMFADMSLAVAGWGRTGQYLSDIKQSAVVQLVPHDECKQYYPNLSNTQLCAAGRTGEDACKGDSGGPLMLLYENNYYVVGVVSGKRLDSPCGTSVPTLYTSVYHYVPWIYSVIS